MKLFLSHATQDSELVTLIMRSLERLEVDVYVAEIDNRAGENLNDKVQAEILTCDWMVVLLTDAGYSSTYVHHEIGLAKAHKKLVIPIITPNIATQDLGMLNGIEYIVFDSADPDSAFHQLAQRIDGLARFEMKRQKDRDDFFGAIAIGVIVGAILLALNE